jgi:SAM-dependent methyltransferase
MIPTARQLLGRAKRRLRPQGQRVRCTLCGETFRTRDAPHSETQECPVCGSIARDRVLYAVVQNEVGGADSISANSRLADLRLLEMSPRRYAMKAPILRAAFGSYVASDFDLSQHQGTIRLDLTSDDDVRDHEGQFDIVLCAHVLEHIPDYRTALANLARLLAPGGVVVLEVPFLEREYVKVTWDEFHEDHARVYHRFGLDLVADLRGAFASTSIYLPYRDIVVRSPEVHPEKFAYLSDHDVDVIYFGRSVMHERGLGSPELCDALVGRVPRTTEEPQP